MQRSTKWWLTMACGSAAAVLVAAASARGDAFDEYGLAGSFLLPGGGGPFDVLADGRLITVVGGDVYAETAVSGGEFEWVGALAGADLPAFGAAFVRVSPDGTRIAVGNGGGAGFDHFEVGVFDVAGLDGIWYSAGHFDGEWVDDTHLALTAGTFGEPGVVTVLDTASPDPADPVNPTVVSNIGGASAGIAFDAAGNLYTGNGYSVAGPSGTGAVKHFEAAAWRSALDGGPPVDFENAGILVVDILSAAALGFDGEWNLHVGGGDFGGDLDYAALVRAAAVADALSGLGPADPFDADQVRRLDPDVMNDANFYDVNFNHVTGALYVREGATVYQYVVPEPGAVWLVGFGVVVLRVRRRCGRYYAARTRAGPPSTCRALGGMPKRSAGMKGVGSAVGGSAGHMPAPASAGLGMAPGAGRNSCVGGALAVGRVWAVRVVSAMCVLCVVGDYVPAESPFATVVVDYVPAPGQFVNDPSFNDASLALGPPVGGGTVAADHSSLVTLGGFGGTITLGFDHPVTDDPANPLGLDAIVYGNAIYVAGDPNRRWAECAYIEISPDGEQWYLIPGSHLTDPADQFETQTWDDDIADPEHPPADSTWIPPGSSGVWETSGHRLPADVFDTPVLANPNGPGAEEEGIFGYADHTPTLRLGDLDGDNVVDDAGIDPEVFYTSPDDPMRVGIRARSGGGDAFDIAWAVDPQTAQPANLTEFTFLRITNGVNFVAGPLGEVSPEIDAVANVEPGLMGDADADGDIDLWDFLTFAGCVTGPGGEPSSVPCRVMDFDGDGDVDQRDFGAYQAAFTGQP